MTQDDAHTLGEMFDRLLALSPEWPLTVTLRRVSGGTMIELSGGSAAQKRAVAEWAAHFGPAPEDPQWLK